MRAARRNLIVATALALVFGGNGSAVPAASPQPALSDDDRRTISTVIAYLEGLPSSEGHFLQTAARGSEMRGTFRLQRPGRARFDYNPPSGLVIASDGKMVTVADRRLKTVHVYPLSATPLGLFLARDIRLDKGVRVTEVRRGSGRVSVTADEGGHGSKGRITLDFTESPLALLGWTVTDARGGVVSVRLSNFERAEPKPADYFKLYDGPPRPAPGSVMP